MSGSGFFQWHPSHLGPDGRRPRACPRDGDTAAHRTVVRSLRRNARWTQCFMIAILQFLVVPVLVLVHAVHGLSADLVLRPMQQKHFIGVDLGTSGARLSIIQEPAPVSSLSDTDTNKPAYEEVYTQAVSWDPTTLGTYDDPNAWIKAVQSLLQSAADTMPLESVQAICISGTSASCLLVEPVVSTTNDDNNNDCSMVAVVQPTVPTARMYNYQVDHPVALAALDQFVPPRHTARSATGSLAKLLAWNAERGGMTTSLQERLCHQADYVIRQFLSRTNNAHDDNVSIVSDWHNCLKLGYDVRRLEWPSWMSDCLHSVGLSTSVLPDRVVSPGTPLGPVAAWACRQFGLPPTCVLTGGTTDSNAAFFAAVGRAAGVEPGTAVTSLGSTLAIKHLSTSYVEDAGKGVYSHRFPSAGAETDEKNKSASGSGSEAWLVGGASNAGCVVLRAHGFSNEELDQLSETIDPDYDTHLSYYPLTTKGERFPIADSDKEPILEPVPDSRGEFLHGILQGISDVERDGYLALGELGATPPTPSQIWTCGGGSRNRVWTQMRQRRLREAFGSSVAVARADNVEASYGAAILAAASFVTTTSKEQTNVR